METKDKKLYERPRMTVVELQHRAAVLQFGSPMDAQSTITDWGDGGTTTEDIFM